MWRGAAGRERRVWWFKVAKWRPGELLESILASTMEFMWCQDTKIKNFSQLVTKTMAIQTHLLQGKRGQDFTMQQLFCGNCFCMCFYLMVSGSQTMARTMTTTRTSATRMTKLASTYPEIREDTQTDATEKLIHGKATLFTTQYIVCMSPPWLYIHHILEVWLEIPRFIEMLNTSPNCTWN